MTQDAVETAVYTALCACFGLSPISDEAVSLIHLSYQDPEPAPRLPRDRDVIFFSVSPDEYAGESPWSYAASNPSSTSHTPSVSSFAAYRLLLVCYGPHAADHARLIRAMIFLDGTRFPREILRKAGVYPVPDPPEPAVLHEPEGSLWRLRADLTIRLRIRDEQHHASRRSSIASAPAVQLRFRE